MNVSFYGKSYFTERLSESGVFKESALRGKCPNVELFLVRIFLYFGQITEIYGVNLRIQSEYRKIWIRNDTVFGHFSRSAGESK